MQLDAIDRYGWPDLIARFRIALAKRKGRAKALRVQQTQPLRLDLGCGSTKRSGFVGVDFDAGADVRWDLNWGLPFDDDVVAEIYSDHCFEHLTLPNMVNLLGECRRVLVAGGILDFTVPHLDPYLEAYRCRDKEFLIEKIYDIPAGQEALYDTCFDRIAWLLWRSGEHLCAFDAESILRKVELAGFRQVHAREFDPTRDGPQRFSSIYVVGLK